jgi:hypothetical protein
VSARAGLGVLERATQRGERGQALVEWLLWAVVLVGMATGLLTIALPVLRHLPAAISGALASVAP